MQNHVFLWVTIKWYIDMERRKFIRKCKQVGVDGLIIVDLPFPENKEFSKLCKKKSITFIQLLSPTTSKERMKKLYKVLMI